jgi:hypothetical protein
MTAVYNIDLAVFDQTLAQVLDRLGVEWTRMGNRIFIGFRSGGSRFSLSRLEDSPFGNDPHIFAGAFPQDAAKPVPVAPRPGQEGVVDVEPFRATRHVTLNWRSSTGSLREEVEAHLAKALAEVPTPDNPAAGWFMIVATALFCVIFLAMALSILFEFLHPRAG